jgi:uncharacterized protein YkvS
MEKAAVGKIITFKKLGWTGFILKILSNKNFFI